MKIGVPKETAPGEQRVALVPDGVRRQTESGVEVLVETRRGRGRRVPGRDLHGRRRADRLRGRPLRRRPISSCGSARSTAVGALRNGQTLVAFLQPLVETELAKALAERGVTSFSMDAIPRITRAQPMDALSSQATVAGYKAVLIAAGSIGKFFPMLTTAAGTIRPAKVMVLGAGVAGLQAIATARRLGAVVSAYDVRPAVKEQVESLGAQFLELDVEGAEGVGGYAIALGEDEQARQQELLKLHAAESDAVISTALIPGKPAPLLLTEEAVAAMQPGSIIVDLAAEMGGNAAGTEAGRTVVQERRHDRRRDEPAGDDAVPREPDVLAQRHELPRADRLATASSSSTSRTRSSATPASPTKAAS